MNMVNVCQFEVGMQSESNYSGAGVAAIELSDTTGLKISLPFSKADLLQGLDDLGAHADALAQPSAMEVGD